MPSANVLHIILPEMIIVIKSINQWRDSKEKTFLRINMTYTIRLLWNVSICLFLWLLVVVHNKHENSWDGHTIGERPHTAQDFSSE